MSLPTSPCFCRSLSICPAEPAALLILFFPPLKMKCGNCGEISEKWQYIRLMVTVPPTTIPAHKNTQVSGQGSGALSSLAFGPHFLYFGRAGIGVIKTGNNRPWDVRQEFKGGVLFSVSRSLPRILVLESSSPCLGFHLFNWIIRGRTGSPEDPYTWLICD